MPTIAITYIKGKFLIELVPLLPLQFLNLNGEEKKFYLIKIIRIFYGINNLDPSAIAERVTYLNLERIKKLIQQNEDLANS